MLCKKTPNYFSNDRYRRACGRQAVQRVEAVLAFFRGDAVAVVPRRRGLLLTIVRKAVNDGHERASTQSLGARSSASRFLAADTESAAGLVIHVPPVKKEIAGLGPASPPWWRYPPASALKCWLGLCRCAGGRCACVSTMTTTRQNIKIGLASGCHLQEQAHVTSHLGLLFPCRCL